MTPEQKVALGYLAEVKVKTGEWCGWVSSRTYRDPFGPPIHWRTAEALERQGLVTLGPWEWEFDPEPHKTRDIFLTEKGRAAANGKEDGEIDGHHPTHLPWED